MMIAAYKLWMVLASLPVLGFFFRRATTMHAMEGGGGAGESPALPITAAVPDVRPNGIDEAIRQAFDDCGLPLHKFAPDFDVASTGKLNEVIHHASARMGRSHPIRTVRDVNALLKGTR
jgi:hypothetical protein